MLVSAGSSGAGPGLGGRFGATCRTLAARRAGADRAGLARTSPFAGTYDLAGDGRLLVLPTPGHTPGHVSLLVDDGSRRLLLAGDLVHEASELLAVAPEIAAWCEEQGVEVLAAHDRAAVPA